MLATSQYDIFALTTISNDEPVGESCDPRLATVGRLPVRRADQVTDPRFRPLVDLWFRLSNEAGGLPGYEAFDILDVPPAIWPSLFLVKLVGRPRRFFYELIGGEIERHNGFSGQNRLLRDLPLRNRRVMAREFANSLRFGGPVCSEGPYIGRARYVEMVQRVICPFRRGERDAVFVGAVRFLCSDDPVPAQAGDR